MALKLPPAGGSQPVVPGAPIVLSWPPLGFQLAVLLEAVQRWEQRAWIDVEVIVTERGKSLRNAVTVHRFTSEDGQNHQVERSLRNVELLDIAHLGAQHEWRIMTVVGEGVNADWAQVGRRGRQGPVAVRGGEHSPSQFRTADQRCGSTQLRNCDENSAERHFDAVAHHLTVELTVTAALHA